MSEVVGMGDSTRTNLQTLLFGIDAGTLSILEPLLETDTLPNLASIFEDGTVGSLESQIPPWTPSAWPSLYTGVNPGKHGVFGFLDFDGYDWDVVNDTHVRERTLWEFLDYHGYSSVIVNVPVTHPPREINGAIVPGYTAPENPDCYPEGLLSDIRNELGDYRVYAPRDATGLEKVDWYERLIQMRGEAFRYLINRFDPEFGFIQFQQTDTVFHEFPGDREKVRTVYSAVDEQIGHILSHCDPDTILLASDHGMGRYGGHEFRPNEFLREHGLVKTTTEGEGMPTWSTIASGQLQTDEKNVQEREKRIDLLETAIGSLATIGITSQRIQNSLDKIGLADFVAKRVPTNVARAGAEQVDFPTSRAYMRDRIELGIRVNLAGREPEGIVPEAEYETLRDELITMFSEVKSPAGTSVFERVVRREEVFSGPYVDDAPDVITVPNEYDEFLSTRTGDGQFSQPSEPYNHKRDGIIALSGLNIDSEAALSDAHLFDVAPTVLALFDLPPSHQMDGTVLPPVESKEPEHYPAYDMGEREGTDDADVEARLSDLGYLE